MHIDINLPSQYMANPLISIIIPIYKVEEYIGKCLNSIYQDKISENLFEVIAVNDGTPDKSMDIVVQYAERYHNIVIINQKNKGVSAARNSGITMAKGDFVTFIDPDDYILGNSLNKALDFIAKVSPKADIITFKSIEPSGSEAFPWGKVVSPTKEYNGVELLNQLHYWRESVWGCLYRRHFLIENKLEFPVGIRNGEDTIFFLECECLAQSIQFIDIEFYQIFERAGSASRTIDKANVNCYLKAIQSISTFEKIHHLTDLQASVISFLKYIMVRSYTQRATDFYSIFQITAILMQEGIIPICVSRACFRFNSIKLMNMFPYFFFLILHIKSHCHKLK